MACVHAHANIHNGLKFMVYAGVCTGACADVCARLEVIIYACVNLCVFWDSSHI